MDSKSENRLAFADTAEFVSRCRALDLDPDQIRKHWLRIDRALTSRCKNWLEIVDTCRIDNGGLLPNSVCYKVDENLAHVVSFIPAAGASSRYFGSIADIVVALNGDDAREQLHSIFLRGAESVRVFIELIKNRTLPSFLETLATPKSLDKDSLEKARDFFALPKALLGCVKEGTSFIQMKINEDEALGFIGGHIFVVSPQKKKIIEDRLKESPHFNPIVLMEQGAAQSTIRFDEDLQPVREQDGSFSIVPAGHGSLSQLLPAVKKKFPQARSVLIRNVDNIMGTSREALEHTRRFVSFFNYVVDGVIEIRRSLVQSNMSRANDIAMDMLEVFFGEEVFKSEKDPLWTFQEKMFHGTQNLAKVVFDGENSISQSELNLLRMLYDRPVNVLGQVPNTGKDVGGTPVFTPFENHDTLYKICLELPHVSEQDRKKFIENPALATHFNPVFVLAEIPTDPHHYDHAERGSWILAKKNYQGREVYYHESVLYELLGNSIIANSCFVEIPRVLFNPHKTILDCKGRSLKNWT